MKIFNKDFMFGAATAAHQVEGNNKNNDCWLMENIQGSVYVEPSLDAVDHYNRYKEDIMLLVKAGLNSYRFSVEWARIEPEKGVFDEKEVKHYLDVLNFCHQNSVTPIVTLHHFSSPIWLIKEGGWESEKTIKYFGEYCKYIVSKIGYLTPYICTINEANMGLQITKIMKKMMNRPNSLQKKNADPGVQVGINVDTQSAMKQYFVSMGYAFGIDPSNVSVFVSPRSPEGDKIIMLCHQKALEVIKEINSDIRVGITLSLYDHQALPGGEESAENERYEDFLHYLPYLGNDDFLGVQNYTRQIHGSEGPLQTEGDARVTQMGNEYYPEALAGVIRYVSNHWDKPIIVTENGVATENDNDRVEFIQRALEGVYQCIEEGIDVKGYMHWSLLDNFEWQKGYEPKFGLIAVDRKTQTRYPKKSLVYLGEIARKGINE